MATELLKTEDLELGNSYIFRAKTPEKLEESTICSPIGGEPPTLSSLTAALLEWAKTNYGTIEPLQRVLSGILGTMET